MKGGYGSTRSGTTLPTSRTEDLKKQKSIADKDPDWRSKTRLIPFVDIVRTSRPKERASEKMVEKPEQTVTSEENVEEVQFPFVGIPAIKRVPFEGPPQPRETSIPDVEKAKEPSYRNQAPVEKRSSKEEWLEIVMNTPVSLKFKDLMATKEIREQLRREVTPRRIEATPSGKATLIADIRPHEAPTIPVLKDPNKVDSFETFLMREDVITSENLPPAICTVSQFALQGIPKGSLVVQDPVELYLNSLAPGEVPKQVLVARDSHSLRTLYPVINGAFPVETVMDSGSQLVSIKEEVANKLGVCWTPDVKINMQSANGSVESSLGLARNIPFTFDGQVTYYFQVHVMKDPAYSVLLGRPFDAVAESWVRNDRHGGQSITITDPKTGSHLTLPTFERGVPRPILKKENKPEDSGEIPAVFQTVFRRSMI